MPRKKTLLIIMAVSLVFPLFYIYQKIFPYKIIPPDYEKYGVTPSEYAIALLGEKIVRQAETLKLKGYIMGVEKITGPSDDRAIDELKKDINISLGRYKGWIVMASRQQLAEINERKAEDARRKKGLIDAGMIDSMAYMNFLLASDKIRIDYDTMAEWKQLPGSHDNYQIILSVINRATGRTEFSEDISFTHPRSYNACVLWGKVVTYGTYLSMAAFCGTLMIYLWLLSEAALKIRRMNKELPLALEKVASHLQSGSYAAAETLINQYLENFPLNTDFLAFKNKLEAVTKGNPRKAEEAYIRYLNLKAKISQKSYPSGEEIEELKHLAQCLELPELNIFIAHCETTGEKVRLLEKKLELEKRLSAESEKITLLLNSGDIDSAEQEINHICGHTDFAEYARLKEIKLPTDTPSASMLLLPSATGEDITDKFSRLKSDIDTRVHESRRCLNDAIQAINSGDIQQARSLLETACKLNRRLEEARQLLNQINLSINTPALKLSPLKTGKEVLIFKKDTLVFGRRQRSNPDINLSDGRISRDGHLKLSVVGNKLIADDLNSTNGTFYGGERIRRLEIEDGGVLDLARACRMTIHIFRGSPRSVNDGSSTLLAMTGKDAAHAARRDDVTCGIPCDHTDEQNIRGIFIETDDSNIILLFCDGGLIPIRFTSVGIIYEKTNAESFLALFGGAFLLYPAEAKEPPAQILYPGGEINYRGVSYDISKL